MIRNFLRVLKRGNLALGGLALIFLITFTSLFAPYISPHDPLGIDLDRKFTPPFWYGKGSSKYILGTDSMGRDILSRIMYGSRYSIMIACLAALFSGIFGTLLGLYSGYYRGSIDSIVMRLVDIQLAFPMILLALSVAVIIGPGPSTLIAVLVVSGWPVYSRVVRGETLAIREMEYIKAARVCGYSDSLILFTQILPNVLPLLIVITTFQLARMVIFESMLSFLGMGIPPPTPTLGQMIAEAQHYLATAWWISTFPGVVIMILVLNINLIGDWLRDELDPRLKV